MHEKSERGWWLPGGGVDAGQLFAEAMEREAEEEAGCEVALTGILRVECTIGGRASWHDRLRIIYAAVPRDAEAPREHEVIHEKGALPFDRRPWAVAPNPGMHK